MSGERSSPVVENWRWVICALLFFATTINYMDRQILGLLAPLLEKKLAWTEVQYSYLVIAFQVAYAIGLAGFGRIIDVFGTKRGYALSISVWSLAAMAHGLAQTVLGFGVARFALGIGEAGNFPAAIKAVAEWFPKRERALATGIFNCGSNVGAILAPVTVPWLTITYGWQASFVVLGSLGFVWLIFWWLLYRSHGSVVEVVETGHATQKTRWKDLLLYRQTWAYIVGITLTAPVWWFYLYWLPKFFSKQFSLDLVHLGPPLLAVYMMTMFGSIGGGWLSSHLLKIGWSLNASRKTALLVCALCTVPVSFVLVYPNIWLVSFLVGLAAAGHQGWSANLFTLVSDLFPQKVVASVVGLGAMFGSISGVVFAQATGSILQATGSYRILFFICGMAYLIALLFLHLLTPRMEPLDETSG